MTILFVIGINPFNTGTIIGIACVKILAKYTSTVYKSITKLFQNRPNEQTQIFENEIPEKLYENEFDWFYDNVEEEFCNENYHVFTGIK